MASVEETTRLVDGIVRLRRVEGLPEAVEDVAPVRRELERQVGPTLSRSRASHLLGVSQTALDRWIETGAVPIVVGPRGRREVPLPFVVELIEAIDSSRREGARRPLAAALAKRRDAAKRVDAALAPVKATGRVAHGHRRPERRALAYHRVIAKRLDDRMLAEAMARVDRLDHEGHLHPRYADRWRAILTQPIDAVRTELIADDQEGRDLRQNSPFAGMLNEQERRRIIELVR
jgi:hypothetical protein